MPNQSGDYRPHYFPELQSTPESRALRKFYAERRKIFPLDKRHRDRIRNPELVEV